ncbi:MAG: isoprenylcysteine carboxylmethyltransferase family protein [Opitutaceae bacterium]
MPNLELKIPPPVLLIATGALMWLTAKATPTLAFAFSHQTSISGVIAVAGVVAAFSGSWVMRRARTTRNPTKPQNASALVVSGIYRFTRNPMYLGLVLVLTAWGLYLSKWLPLLFLPAFVAYLTRFQIVPEERVLAAKFGGQFAAYRSRVRRWC